MWAVVRTSTNFAHLASFQAIEVVDPAPSQDAGLFVSRTSENKAFFTKYCSILIREEGEMISSHSQSPCFPIEMPGTMKVQVRRIQWVVRLKDDQ